jgi:hypothetical protein
LVVFLASTVAKNLLQAMGIAVAAIIATVIGCDLFLLFEDKVFSLAGIGFNPRLTSTVAILTGLVIAPWLAYGNFKYFQEGARIWRRNILAVAGATLFIYISGAAIYNRVWEIFETAELPHGPAKLSLATPPCP